jgi:hypothetical protein
MLGGVVFCSVGYGLYGGNGDAVPGGGNGGPFWADVAWGTLKSPRTAAKPAVTNADVCRRIGVPPWPLSGRVAFYRITLLSSDPLPRSHSENFSKFLVKWQIVARQSP